MTTAKKYYPCLFRLDRVDRDVIWYSSDKDGLVRHDGRIVALPSAAALRDFAGQHGLSLEREAPPLYDWDAIEKWCAEPAASELDADTFLNAWNMLLDARHSEKRRVYSIVLMADAEVFTTNFSVRTTCLR